MDSPRAPSSLFRALLHLYPAEFRAEYGSEMERLLADRLSSEPRLLVWRDTLAGLFPSALQEHLSLAASDLRYAFRRLAAARAFALLAVLITALGIGATAAVFSLVDAVLLRSLPYSDPSRLVYLWSPNRNFKGVPDELGPNVPDFYEWQRLSRSFSSLALLNPKAVNLVDRASSTRIGAAFVSGTFFRTLGVHPILGRPIEPSDDAPGHERVAVIGAALWRSRFDSDPSVLGRSIRLNRQTYSIVGVMPAEFGYPFDGDIPYDATGAGRTSVWLPAAFSTAQKSDRVNFESADAVARLRPGVTPAQAQAELSAIENTLDARYPAMWRGWTVLVRPVASTILGPVEKMFWLLLGAVLLVLLIAVANVSNLLLARAAGRAHEMGVRTALGAPRRRLLRQMLTESVVLCCLGGVLGVLFAWAAVHLLTRLNPGNIPRFESASLDLRVLFVALALSLASGLASGLLPALAASRSGISSLLNSGGPRLTTPGRRGRFALVAAEVALSCVLLTASALLIRSYLALAAVAPGFSPSALTFRLRLDEKYSTPQSQDAFYRRYLAALSALPGAGAVGAASSTPLSDSESVTFAEIRGFGRAPSAVENRSVTPTYRKALGVPLLAGRDFDARDIGANVAIVNQAFVRAYFGGRNPLGGQLRTGIGDLSGSPWQSVVGIIGDIRHTAIDQPALPLIWQPAPAAQDFALQCLVPADVLAERARAALRSLDPALALTSVRTMRQRVSHSSARRRFETTLLVAFASLALALALSGLYALLAFSVRQRRAEIAIRIALGAPRSRIVALVLAQGLRMTAAGLLIGLAASLAATRLIAAWLFQVRPADPFTFAAVPVFLLAVACCACLLPAWKAARVQPLDALRQE